MKEKRDCKIVQDLLPNYIEKLTNEETNRYIEEHLLECDECRNILENMKKDWKVSNKAKIDCKKVKYIKKYSKKLKILEITTILLLFLTIGVFIYYTFFFRDAYLRAAKGLYDMATEGMYPDTFYATIEEIKDAELYGIKTIKVKGLDINDINHIGEFYFDVILDNIGDNFKIESNGETIKFEQLKVGQTIAVYEYSNKTDTNSINDTSYLSGVRKIVILDEQ